MFDHSWSLLSEGEREALRWLSVFRGGFTRAAAAEVAGASLPLLARLVDASLLSMSPEGRYDRHPLLSVYTREKLAESPEERAEAEQRHGAYFLGLVRELEPALWTLAYKEAWRVFLEELANIRAAWDWATLNLRVDEIERTTPAMFEFFILRFTEGLEYFGTTFEFFGSIAERLDESNPSHRGALGTVLVHQVLLSHFVHRVVDDHRIRSLAKRGFELLSSLGEHRDLCRGYLALGDSSWQEGEFSEAKEYFQQALALARKHGRSSDVFYALRGLTMAEEVLTGFAEGDLLPQFDQFMEEALEEVRALGNLPGVAFFLTKRAYSSLMPQRRFEETRALLWEGYRLAEELGHHELVNTALNELAEVALELGEVDQAAAHLRESQRWAEEGGLQLHVPHIQVRLGRVAMAEGDFEGARELFLGSMKAFWDRKELKHVDYALAYFAALLAAEGSPGEAVALLEPFRPLAGLYGPVLDDLESSLSREEFAAAVERGRGMTREDVMNELLAEL